MLRSAVERVLASIDRHKAVIFYCCDDSHHTPQVLVLSSTEWHTLAPSARKKLNQRIMSHPIHSKPPLKDKPVCAECGHDWGQRRHRKGDNGQKMDKDECGRTFRTRPRRVCHSHRPGAAVCDELSETSCSASCDTADVS